MRRLMTFVLGALAVGCAYAQSSQTAPVRATEVLEGVTFDRSPGKIFVPVRELGEALEVYVGWDSELKQITLDEVPVAAEAVKALFDGTNMVDVLSLESAGLGVDPFGDEGVKVSTWKKALRVVVPEKWVEISLGDQRLIAWQGERLVMDTNVSTGRSGFRTPTGEFEAGPEKSRHRVSRTYDNSPMPYSVQLYKGYFIHGYPSVPAYPASHGCIRMPLGKKNAAEFFFNWIDLGTAVSIRNDWSDKVEALLQRDHDARVGQSSGSKR